MSATLFPFHRRKLFLVLLLLLLLEAGAVFAQSTGFTYQGRLQDTGTPANGSYDLQFTLWDAVSGGTQQPQPSPVAVTRSAVSVANGIFTVQLDFGANAFPGADRFLEIGVRPAGSGGFTILTPRQPVTSTPYAIRSANATTADSATNATNAATATNAAQLGGFAAGQYVLTSDSRMTDARNPLPNSTNYIQSQTASTQSAGFNISGNGTAGGNLSAGNVQAGSSSTGGNFVQSAPNLWRDAYRIFRGGNQVASMGMDSGGSKLQFFTGSSSSDSTARVTVDNSGNVGIGTPNPSNKLSVSGIADFTGVSIGGGPIPANTTLFVNGFVNLAMLGIPVTTHVCIQNTGYLAQCASAAEYVPTRDAGKGFPETADLVSIAPKVANPYSDTHGPFTVQKSATSCDDSLLGFIVRPESGADGKKLNEHYLPLAIYGYFPAKVTLENGPIKRGDPITSSSKPGYGMKATNACRIIGYALEDADKEGKIQVFAHQSEYTAPQVTKLQAQVTALQSENAAEQKENANRQSENIAVQSENVRLQARLNRLERTVGVLHLASAQKHKPRRFARVRLVTRTLGRSGAGERKLAALR